MKLWTSGELQADISDAYRSVRKRIETSVNRAIEKRDYGGGLVQWNYLAIILSSDGPKGYNEVKRYNKRNKKCEFRLIIDHAQFKEGDATKKTAMVCESLLQSLSVLESMNIPDFNVSLLREDFLDVAKRQGWLV